MYLRRFPSRLQNINLSLLKFINLGGLSNLIEEEKESELFLFSPHTNDKFSVFDSEQPTSDNIKINKPELVESCVAALLVYLYLVVIKICFTKFIIK